jgi:hypothetical protein
MCECETFSLCRLSIDNEELNINKLSAVIRLLYIKNNNNKLISSLLTIAVIIIVLLMMSSTSTLKQLALAQKNATTIPASSPSPPITTTKPTSNFLIYENPAIGIKMKYPFDWLKDATRQGVTFVLPTRNNNSSSNPEQLFLARLDTYSVPGFPPNISLKTMADGVINGYKRTLPNFQLESYTNTTLAGSPAVKIIYTFIISKEGSLKATDIGTIKNNRLYVIQYYVPSAKYQNYLPILRKIVDSFTITK